MSAGAVGGPPNGRRMSRRSFLRYSAATGVAAAAAPGVASAPAGAAERSSQGVPVPDFEWEGATIAELQHAMESGGNSSRRIVQDFIERIGQVDLHGPRLNSVIEINPTPWRSPTSSIANVGRAMCADRCTGSRSC